MVDKFNKRKRKGFQLEMFSPVTPHGKLREFGGDKYRKSNPKRARPIETNKPIHLVLKSLSLGSKYSMRLPKNYSTIKQYVYDIAAKFKIKVERFENVGNHLHLVIRVPMQSAYTSYIRGICSAIARHVLEAKKGHSKDQKFWFARPYTRIVTWGQEFKRVLKYLNSNRIQAIGFHEFVQEQIRSSA